MKVMGIEKAIAEILESWPQGDDKFTQGICQGLRAAIVILQKQPEVSTPGKTLGEVEGWSGCEMGQA